MPKNSKAITKESGILILLLGDTGAGKSTFINNVAGKELAPVGHEVLPCTIKVDHVIIKRTKEGLPRSPIVLVDTPGFNNGEQSDMDILRQIVRWLEDSCSDDVQFGGLVYLHDMTQSEKPGLKSSGDSSGSQVSGKLPEKVVVATVKAKDPKTAGKFKEKYWKELRVEQLENSEDSAWKIIDMIISQQPNECTLLGEVRTELNETLQQLPKYVPSNTVPQKKGVRFKLKLFFRR